MDIKVNLEEARVYLRVYLENFEPGRPAPACSNPDSPLFSDPGDDPEWDSMQVVLVFTKKTQKMNPITNDFDEEILETEIDLPEEAYDAFEEAYLQDVIEDAIAQYEQEMWDCECDRMERDIEYPPER